MKLNRMEWSVVFGYVAIGLIVGQFGPMLSAASVDLGFGSERIGQLTSLVFTTSLLGMLVAIAWGARLGKIRLMLGGTCLLIAGYVLAWLGASLTPLVIATCVIGVGFGCYQAGVNALAVDAVSDRSSGKQAARLSFFQVFFGVGTMVAPLLVLLAVDHLGGWRNSHLLVLLAGPIVFSVFLMLQSRDEVHTGRDVQSPQTESSALPWTMWLLMLMAGSYVAVETSVFSWLPYYWDQVMVGRHPWSGAQVVASFWFVFSLSRLTMGRVVEWLGPDRMLILFGFLVLLLVLVWVLIGATSTHLVLGVVWLLALLFGCMVPTMLVRVNQLVPGRSGLVSGIFMVFITLSASGFPLVIGAVSREHGMEVFPSILFACTVLSLCVTVWALALTRREAVRKQGL
jgi:fucose permease